MMGAIQCHECRFKEVEKGTVHVPYLYGEPERATDWSSRTGSMKHEHQRMEDQSNIPKVPREPWRVPLPLLLSGYRNSLESRGSNSFIPNIETLLTSRQDSTQLENPGTSKKERKRNMNET